MTLPLFCVSSVYMSFKTITVSDEAHKLLKRLKQPGQDSFSKVILRHLQPPLDTCGDLLEHLEQHPVTGLNFERMEESLRTRGKRSNR